MDIWESYESLPALERITITFSIVILLIVAVFKIDKWVKSRQSKKAVVKTAGAASPSFSYSNLERQANGALIAYIAYWRYLIFGLLYAAGFYVSINSFILLYHELPVGFWKNWDKVATATTIFLVLILVLPYAAFRFLKSNYKKVQLAINNNNVQFLTSASRGGILFSENYAQVYYKDIISTRLSRNYLGIGVIDIETSNKTQRIMLLLSATEQEICYRALDEAIKKYTGSNKQSMD